MMSNYIEIINSSLYKAVYELKDAPFITREAILYALEAGGKRIRPILTLEFCKICGGNIEKALPASLAIEMMHTYSLIHDDMECMDNDDIRRGKPSVHKAYGEDIALLAGDALQALSFETLCNAQYGDIENLRCSVKALAHFSGMDGMIGGQVLDKLSEKAVCNIETLNRIDNLKTCALIKCACVLGIFASENYNNKQLDAALRYAKNLGCAFQIIDDILDITSTTEKLGKGIGSDLKNNKSTYISLLGIKNARKMAKEYTELAVNALDDFSGDAVLLKELAVNLFKREV